MHCRLLFFLGLLTFIGCCSDNISSKEKLEILHSLEILDDYRDELLINDISGIQHILDHELVGNDNLFFQSIQLKNHISTYDSLKNILEEFKKEGDYIFKIINFKKHYESGEYINSDLSEHRDDGFQVFLEINEIDKSNPQIIKIINMKNDYVSRKQKIIYSLQKVHINLMYFENIWGCLWRPEF